MALSQDAVTRLMIALGDATRGNEVASAIDSGSTHSAQAAAHIAAFIVATSTSTTTNFASLQVGDLVVHIPAVAGNSNFWTVATAGTLPAAAVVNDLYIVVRGFVPAPARNVKF